MNTEQKKQRHDLFTMAWEFVRANGMTMADALKTAWRNTRLTMAMRAQVIAFEYLKADGSRRTAHGTLLPTLTPQTKQSGRATNGAIQTYYDTDRQAWRSYRKANLLGIA